MLSRTTAKVRQADAEGGEVGNSCGQCTPCKQDGLALARLLGQLSRSEAGAHELELLRSRVSTVADEARCFLAAQH